MPDDLFSILFHILSVLFTEIKRTVGEAKRDVSDISCTNYCSMTAFACIFMVNDLYHCLFSGGGGVSMLRCGPTSKYLIQTITFCRSLVFQTSYTLNINFQKLSA